MSTLLTPDELLLILNEYSAARDAFHKNTGNTILMAGVKRTDTVKNFITMVNNYSMLVMGTFPLMSDAQLQAFNELTNNMLSMRRQETGNDRG